MSEDSRRKMGPPTHTEVRADERKLVEAELSEKMDFERELLREEMREEMQKALATLKRTQDAHMSTVEAVAKTQGAIPALKRTKINVTNDTIRGIAHATGGASHDPLPDGTPWTPVCPEWVFANYGGISADIPETEDGKIAEYLYKQAYLNDIRMTQEMLPDAMEAYKERGETPRLVEPPAYNAQDLAAAAVM